MLGVLLPFVTCSDGGADECHAPIWQTECPLARRRAASSWPPPYPSRYQIGGSLRPYSAVPSECPHIQARRRYSPRGSNAMRAFRSRSYQRSRCALLTLSVLGILLCSSVPSMTSARTRPVEDMGDPDPTEGTHPTQGAAKAGRLVSTYRETRGVPRGIAVAGYKLKDLLLAWRWMSWR